MALNPHRVSQEEPPPPTRRAVLMPVLAALAGITVVAAYVYWQQANRPMRVLPRMGTLALPGTTGEGMVPPGGSDLAALLSTDDQRALLSHPSDVPLPAGECVIPPGEDATAFLGVRREAEGLVEEIAHWRVPGDDAAGVHRALLDAAHARGFTPLGPTRTSERSVNLVLTATAPPRRDPRGPAVTQTLVLRTVARDGQVRILAWLRYAMPAR